MHDGEVIYPQGVPACAVDDIPCPSEEIGHEPPEHACRPGPVRLSRKRQSRALPDVPVPDAAPARGVGVAQRPPGVRVARPARSR